MKDAESLEQNAEELEDPEEEEGVFDLTKKKKLFPQQSKWIQPWIIPKKATRSYTSMKPSSSLASKDLVSKDMQSEKPLQIQGVIDQSIQDKKNEDSLKMHTVHEDEKQNESKLTE